MLTLVALLLFIGSAGRERATALLFVVGLLIGLAAATRLTFLAIAPLGLLAALLTTEPGPKLASMRLRHVIANLAGLVVGLLPAVWYYIANPDRFMFGNVWYHQLNPRYWEQVGYTRAMTFGGKLDYLWQVVTAEQIDEIVAVLDRSLGDVLATVGRLGSD